MPYFKRKIEKELQRAARHFPAVVITGPRRAGKTTVLKTLFPKADYVLLEDPDIIGRIRSDPKTFISELRPPVILDEIQNTPEILNYIRTRIDREPHRFGQWLITGSQEAPLMKNTTESMAGRAAILELLPLSTEESNKVSLFRGGFPEPVTRTAAADIWFRSYVLTYMERDVRQVSGIRDLATFRRFLALLASRCGQMLNRSDLASAMGVTVPTISQWLNVLEITVQIILVPPFYENFGKRLIKSPKLYFTDTGMACHLLGIDSEKELERSPFKGALFESFVASEIVKHQLNGGFRRELYYFRDQQGLEVDFLIPQGNRKLCMIEAKSSSTVSPDMAGPLIRLEKSMSRYKAGQYVVYRPRNEDARFTSLHPSVKAVSVKNMLSFLK
jgi:hypothetical protein